MSEHTIKAFDTELQELVRKVAEMGGLAERQITDSVVALIRRDTAQPERVMAIDTNIDALQREIEERAILIIALVPFGGIAMTVFSRRVNALQQNTAH